MMTSMTLGDLATATPGATRVFMRHRLDFCCGGARTLADACAGAGLDPMKILAEIDAERARAAPDEEWSWRPLGELADHIEHRYHATLRRELPLLVEAARKVERVHAMKPAVPRGLAEALADFARSLEDHMRREELVLFPMIRRGQVPAMPIRAMQNEHDMHAIDLARIRALTNDLSTPPDACATWRALYDGLRDLEAELMQHIRLENNVLFPRALD